MRTQAARCIAMLERAGVRRLFGMPGGGSIADLIEAAAHAGMPFTLAHTETAAAFMACAQAEITGHPGACLATLGPGAASLVNGVAHAFLDRVPLIAITDCASIDHQKLPQRDMFRPIVKWTGGFDRAGEAFTAVQSGRPGPVHLEIASSDTAALWDGALDSPPPALPADDAPLDPPIGPRPVLIAGLGARSRAAEIRAYCDRHRVPALVTYKAKGVVPDDHPWFAGIFTNGTLERHILDRAGQILTIGLDPVELIRDGLPTPARAAVGNWKTAEPYAACQRANMRVPSRTAAIAPYRVVELTAARYSAARITVDAGAHMFPVMSLWPAREPNSILISNGLSTMGFALPSAIGAALLDSGRPVVAFTGDGGLMMCLGELRTAARERLRLRIVVFDDAELSLIKVKQAQRGYATDSTSIGPVDWRSVGAGFGVRSLAAATEESLAAALDDTIDEPGPVLIAAKVDPGAYCDTIRALRGGA